MKSWADLFDTSFLVPEWWTNVLDKFYEFVGMRIKEYKICFLLN